MNKYAYLTAFAMGLAYATPAHAGWFTVGTFGMTGAGDSGFGTSQMVGSQNTEVKTSSVASDDSTAGKDKNASFVAPKTKTVTKNTNNK